MVAMANEHHSPGPWRWEGQGLSVIDADGRCVLTVSWLKGAADLRAVIEVPAMIELLRSAEWRGSAGRCPWCDQWSAVPGKVEGGHTPVCKLAALLARIDGGGNG